jgi:HK97 gp10 family phage protein
MTANIKVDASDLMRTVRTLDGLPRNLRQRAIRIALNKAGSVMRSAAQPMTPTETGALRKSLSIKVTQKKSTRDWHLVVGPKRKSRPGTPKPTTGKRRGRKPNRRNPARYSHLVHNGTVRAPQPRPYLATAAAVAGPVAIIEARKRLLQELHKITINPLTGI